MKPEVIIKAMQTVISKQDAGAEQRIAGALAALTEAKDAHAASMEDLSGIDASIRRCEQERQAALDESAQAEQDWRSRFRTLRGNLTPEMRDEHGKRIASRELAGEFTGLIAELEKDKTRAMLKACTTGSDYQAAHKTAFTAYANSEWKQALAGIGPALLRAFLLRIRSLEMSGETSPRTTVTHELDDALNMQSVLYHFDMAQEPVLSVTGMNRPAVTGVDMELFRSPAKRMQLAARLAAQDHEQAEG
ncbi:capsid protein [Enterobacter roggenkampii]|uniref:capsid protein n=1 Tax=Enterobacter roggenkampii TaxID=1812935 RepID=UPI00165DA390|nr:capsid protein [Enterobacter roggenkampii]